MKILITLMFILALVFVAYAEVDKSVCSQPKVVGPCRAAGRSYFYNTAASKCEDFFYGGCEGNDNRFKTKEECEKLCV